MEIWRYEMYSYKEVAWGRERWERLCGRERNRVELGCVRVTLERVGDVAY